MTTAHLQKVIGRMQVLKFHTPVCENVKYLFSDDFERDVISVSKSGMVCEFEIKTSRSDFKADLKKIKRYYTVADGNQQMTKFQFYQDKNNAKRLPNYFSYACPTDLIKLSEIPEQAGLYYVEGEEVTEIRKPKRLHAHLHDIDQISRRVCRIMSERHFLGVCRQTYENNESSKRQQKWESDIIKGEQEIIDKNLFD